MPIKNHKQKPRKTLLDKLQEESWQLELIVSGIVIFLLIGLYPHMDEFGKYISSASMGSSKVAGLTTTLWSFVGVAYIALIGMFLLHLAVRGMWIGAIGLRSVSGDFDHDHLNYPARYGKFLRRRLGSFDDYIDRLERNASVTFSLAFLLFFAIFSLGLFFVVIVAGVLLLTLGDGKMGPEEREYLGGFWFNVFTFTTFAWVLLMVLTGLTYFVDFITFGWVKRRKWFGRVYYPFYRFLGWVTLARLYRPFYYNIIDNPFGKKLVRVYSAITFVGIILTTLQVTPFEHFTYSRNVHGVINADQYLENNGRDVQNSLSQQNLSLASRYASEDYLELFLPLFESKIEDALKQGFPELRPLSESSIGFMNRMMSNQDSAQVDSTLSALSAIHQVFLNDSLITDVPWRFYEHPIRKQPGLRYDIPVYDLARGEYWIRVESQTMKNGTLQWQQIAYISFLR
jgi:hypothetical protein